MFLENFASEDDALTIPVEMEGKFSVWMGLGMGRRQGKVLRGFCYCVIAQSEWQCGLLMYC